MPKRTHLNLKRRSDVTPLTANPEARLRLLDEQAILDEDQTVPDVFLAQRRRAKKALTRFFSAC